VPAPRQGEIWLASLDPTVGDEIQKRRPVLVVSRDEVNARSGAGERVVIVVPLTTTQRAGTVRIAMPAPSPGAPDRASYAVPWRLRSVGVERLERPIHHATADEVALVRRLISVLLGPSA